MGLAYAPSHGGDVRPPYLGSNGACPTSCQHRPTAQYRVNAGRPGVAPYRHAHPTQCGYRDQATCSPLMPWMNAECRIAGSATATMSGTRRRNSSNATLISRRARLAPRHGRVGFGRVRQLHPRVEDVPHGDRISPRRYRYRTACLGCCSEDRGHFGIQAEWHGALRSSQHVDLWQVGTTATATRGEKARDPLPTTLADQR